MAAELRLNVALDLQYFKRQLPKLSQAAAGFQLPIQVKFDRRSLNNEFRLLGNQFSKRRNYTIQVNDSQLEVVRKKAENLVDYLKTNLTGKKHIVEIEYRESGRPSRSGVSRDDAIAAMVAQGQAAVSAMGATRMSGGNVTEAARRAQFESDLMQRTMSVSKKTGKQGLKEIATGFGVDFAKSIKKSDLAKKISQSISLEEISKFDPQLSMRRGAFGHIASGQIGGSVIPNRFDRIAASGLMPKGSGLPMLPPAAESLVQQSRQRLQSSRFTAPSIPKSPTGGGGGIGGGGGRGGGGFGRSLGLLGGMPQLPGAGSVRELASEFGNATKQVLLFGTAYKGLAFLMDFPSQVGAAVGALQSFNNTLKAISPSAEAAADSNAFILDIVNRYNVPLQSARDGFTKLYASMAPAGFEGDQIEEIFLGISQAAATFGMSSDKVDRMNYAFAQMASKGQIMSEELKGQLGDVLPGAMGIFAEAAGLEGPDAIQKFSKALEDGAFQGENMVALLKNVGQVMQDEFGPGAEGAARTFQGLMNRMQNSMTLLYEAFEPVAVQFLNAVVVPMTQGIKTISDGVSAYFSQTAASTSEGQAFANQLKSLEGAFNGIKENVIGVIEVFKQFSRALLPVVKLLLQIAGNPIVGYLARLYAIVLPLNIAFRVTRGALAAVNVQMLLFKARTAAGVKTITAFRAMMVATGASAKATSASIRGLGLAIKAALGSTVIGAIIVGLGILIEKIITLRSKMDEVRTAAQQASAAIQHMTGAQAASTEQQAQADVETLRNLRQRTQGRLGKVEVTQAEQEALTRSGESPVKFATERGLFGGVTKSAMGASGRQVDAALQQASERRTLASNRAALVQREQAERDAKLNAELADISLEGGGSDGGGGGGGGTDQSDSAAILRIKQQIAEEERGILLNEKGRNELNLIRLNQELQFQEIAEMNANEATKAVLREEARIEAGKKYTKVFEELANATVKEAEENRKALEQQKDSRATLAGIILEAQYASKQISEEEYKTGKFLLEQEATRRRILGLEGLTPEERQRGIEAVDSMQPPEEQGKVSAWIEKTEKELEDFQGMATSAADSIASEFGTAFSGILQGTTSLSEGLGTAFSNIGKMFADMVMQMLAKWAMLQVMKGLFPGMAEGGVVSASGGGGLPSLIPGFANGGVVKGPTMAMVGEGRFNEAVVPLPNGKSIPVEMGGGAGSSISTNITVNVNNGQVSSKTSGSQGNDLARNLEGAVKQVIMREMQPGGMISSGR